MSQVYTCFSSWWVNLVVYFKLEKKLILFSFHILEYFSVMLTAGWMEVNKLVNILNIHIFYL